MTPCNWPLTYGIGKYIFLRSWPGKYRCYLFVFFVFFLTALVLPNEVLALTRACSKATLSLTWMWIQSLTWRHPYHKRIFLVYFERSVSYLMSKWTWIWKILNFWKWLPFWGQGRFFNRKMYLKLSITIKIPTFRALDQCPSPNIKAMTVQNFYYFETLSSLRLSIVSR